MPNRVGITSVNVVFDPIHYKIKEGGYMCEQGSFEEAWLIGKLVGLRNSEIKHFWPYCVEVCVSA